MPPIPNSTSLSLVDMSSYPPAGGWTHITHHLKPYSRTFWCSHKKKALGVNPGMVAHTSNPRIWEAEAGGPQQVRGTQATERVPGLGNTMRSCFQDQEACEAGEVAPSLYCM